MIEISEEYNYVDNSPSGLEKNNFCLGIELHEMGHIRPKIIYFFSIYTNAKKPIYLVVEFSKFHSSHRIFYKKIHHSSAMYTACSRTKQ